MKGVLKTDVKHLPKGTEVSVRKAYDAVHGRHYVIVGEDSTLFIPSYAIKILDKEKDWMF